MLLGHLHWAFWSLIMMPSCDTAEGVEKSLKFYLEYAYARTQLYYKLKPIMII